ncbi:MAG: hypothetical protein ACRDMV_04245 [Streptosporangiales bacterium]
MNTLVNVARYHLVDRVQLGLLPPAVTAFAFLVNLIIFALLPTRPDAGYYAGGLLAPYIFFFILGVLTLTRSLPFAFALGLSRRSYYLGTVGCFLTLAGVYGFVITVLQAIERATGGWGIAMHFFRVPWILDGAWYLTWVTAFVLLMLVFAYGMWFGLISRRWSVTGVLTFAAVQVTVLLAAAVVVTWLDAWASVTAAFATLSVLGFTGVVAAVALALTLGGFGTMRKATV